MNGLAHLIFGCLVVPVYFVVFPFAMIWLKETRPQWFAWPERALVVLGEFAVSWCFTMGVILVPDWCGWWSMRGPEAAMAGLFGWLYMPLAGLPIGLVYWLFKLGERRRPPVPAGRKRRRAIALLFAFATVLVGTAVAFLPQPKDAVAEEFRWLLDRPEFAREPLQKEPPFIREYEVDAAFAKRLCETDLSAYGFDAWQELEGGYTIGGDRVTVSLRAQAGEVRRAQRRQMRKVGASEVDELLAEIYVDTRTGQVVLYCPHNHW